MHYIKLALFFIALTWPITLLAVMLLSVPQFFSRKVLRYRRLFIEPERESGAYVREPWTLHRIVVAFVVAPFAAFFFVVFGIPIIIGMTFVGVCVSYRNRRHLAYRALRRHHVAWAYIRSHFVGLPLFISTFTRSRRPVWSRHA